MEVDERETALCTAAKSVNFLESGAKREPIVRLNSFRRPLAALAVAFCSAGSVAIAQSSDYESIFWGTRTLTAVYNPLFLLHACLWASTEIHPYFRRL